MSCLQWLVLHIDISDKINIVDAFYKTTGDDGKVDYGPDGDEDGEKGDYESLQVDTPSSEPPDFDQFIAQIIPPDEVMDRVETLKPSEHTEPLNILIFALDSMSHMCYQRKLPRTYKFIQETLGSTILNGYNIVGDATTAALIPLLTGHYNKVSSFSE